jgi:hypothetical protein
MARSHFWQHILNSEGVPISGATVTLFDETDDSEVLFYTRESSASLVTYTTTSSSGLFEVWVPDRVEGGYGTNATFTLVVSGSEMDTRMITGVQLLFQPPRFCEFDMFSRLSLLEEHYYSINIQHNLNTEHPYIQAWNTQTRQTMDVSCSSISLSAISVSAYYLSDYWPQDSIPVRIVLLGEDT